MKKTIIIKRTELTEFDYGRIQVAYNGRPPDVRNQEPLIMVLNALT